MKYALLFLLFLPSVLSASKPKAIFLVKEMTQDRQHYLLQPLHPTQFLVTVGEGNGNLNKGEAITCEVEAAKDPGTKYTSVVLRCHELKLKVNEVLFEEEK